MRNRYFILLILSFKTVYLFSQIKIINTSLLYPDSSILYVGIDNRLKIEGLDSSKEYIIKTSLANCGINTYLRNRFNEYLIRVNKVNVLDTLYLLYKGKIVFTKLFRTELIGEPYTQLDNIPQGLILKSQLTNCKELKVMSNPICILKDFFPLLTFQTYIQCKKCDELPVMSTSGSYLLSELYKIIPFLSSGDKITFEEIKVRACITRKLPSITYTIK